MLVINQMPSLERKMVHSILKEICQVYGIDLSKEFSEHVLRKLISRILVVIVS